jgi:hypothetical protein
MTWYLWPDDPEGSGSLWHLGRINQHVKIEYNKLQKTWICKKYKNQTLRIWSSHHLQPKIWQGTTQIERSIEIKLLGLEKGDELKQARDKWINLKFTPTKEATSLLRYPLRVGYHKEPLASPNPHKGSLVLPKRNPQRMGNTNDPGCSTWRGHSTGDA